MVYKKLTNEQLQKLKYPNLIAELIESGYSICTCADHMRLPDGRHRGQDDKEVWDKLYGKEELLASEAIGLAGLFGVDMKYLFASDLKTTCGETFAFIRWYDWNKKKEKEYEEYVKRQEIERELCKKPYLLDFMMKAVKWSQDELNMSVKILQERRTA